MRKAEIPNPRELIIAKGSHKGNAFVTIGIYRVGKKFQYLVSTAGPKVPWSAVSNWDYLSAVAPSYDIWGPAETPDPLAGISYPFQSV